MEEDVHRGWSAQVPTQDLEGPDERPTVRVQLGRGCVDIGEQLPLKECEGKAQTKTFEHSLVKKEKVLPAVGPIVRADRLLGVP